MRPSEMDPDRWHRIDQILEAALDTPPAERGAFVDEVCGNDADLRAEVEALLEAHGRAGESFDRPPGPGAAFLAGPAPESVVSPVEVRLVGPFRLLREIGRGGMGVVYLAEDTRLGRHVALKALPPWLGTGAEARRRFVAEARAVSSLDHPNIATLYETDATDDGQLYMVFAFYEGETLTDRIGRGPMKTGHAVAVARGIAAGLEAAHAKGIVHRDVKPSNVLITDDGEVKLLDFGVAKVAGEEATRSGLRLGTVAYMSPEQVSGAQVDGRTDLWALGVVLYEMLTGERPFTGREPASLIQSILHDDPAAPGTRRADLPDALDTVIETLLRKHPEDRYGSAGELLGDLDAVASSGEQTSLAPGRPAATAATLVPAGRPPRRATSRRPRIWRLAAAIGAVVVAAAGSWLVAGRRGGTGEAVRVRRVAVLPLENRTGDPDQQYFVDGIHEAVISELGRIATFDVISRRSVLRYRDAPTPVPEIAGALGVDAVVEGSVAREGDSLAITASLVAASPERQLWTASYRRAVGGVYEVAGDVARSVAGEIGFELAAADSVRLGARQEVDPRAYDAYLLGQFHLEQRDREGFEQARKYLTRAIELDSTFAPAYTTLAEAYGSATFFGLFRPSETLPQVRSLAEKALRLDSTLSEAHRVAGAVKLYWDWDWEGAERDVRRALTLNPSDADAHRLLSEVLSVQGRYEEALQAVDRGSELERLVPFARFRPAVVLIYRRDFDRAIDQVRAGLDFFPEFWQGRWLLCMALEAEGRVAGALSECERAAALSRRASMALAALGFTYARAGLTGEAAMVLRELEGRSEVGYVSPSDIAVVYGALGEHDRAFEWLERAYEERDVNLVHLADIPLFDPLRADPRFDRLRRRVGLSD